MQRLSGTCTAGGGLCWTAAGAQKPAGRTRDRFPCDRPYRCWQGNLEDVYQEEQAAKAARAAAAAEEGGADGRPLTKKERTALEKAAAQV